jgi:hypothetical protein
VQVLESLEFDDRVEIGVHPVVRAPVRVAAHVRRERRTVAPAAHHDELTRIAVGLPDLEVHEPVGGVDEVGATAECRDELLRTRLGDPEP